ncbi:3-hydroxyacyl-CoA dehydrogenase [Rhizobium sp. C4]|uniref:3-hydroxyacyl-CoA dehydrogenase n=1 Tax=Rhizobium sp. C4 TaxID=1349800 RepID=UPI001E5DC97A|nr:3-hydroxyacyl-CoA dehydrogenase [Rhizobium sp. C4]MCD2175761.1 3-hydroxyacyl-CoA dehydrogenase [Rhizobium sp. C4]
MPKQSIRNVTVAGTGVLGAQIAFQTAFHGFDVTVYDINDTVLEGAKAKFTALKQTYIAEVGATQAAVDAAFDRIAYSSDLKTAVADADLMIEAVPENVDIKRAFYAELAKVAPPSTIFASNSSTMLPSQFAAFTGRPEHFLNLHFANQIWTHNTAEIMGHPGTDPAVFDAVVAFAKAIGMVALPLKKEQPGYLLNTLLIPMLNAALQLLVNEVADAQTIDKTWMVANSIGMGPFAILDIVGLTTAYNIIRNGAEQSKDPVQLRIAEYLKTNYIDKGKLGAASGEGFYHYPNPAYAQPDFLT